MHPPNKNPAETARKEASHPITAILAGGEYRDRYCIRAAETY